MKPILPLAMAAILSVAFPFQAGAVPLPPQDVIISFDGAHELQQWERSRALARRTGARFTYFLSCTFLLSPETAAFYRGPGMAPGRSNVGFAASREEVAERLRQIWAAVQEGHEIASHGCGHFDGKEWTEEEWRAELRDFSRFLRDAWTLNEIPGEPAGWHHLAEEAVIGFRAPYLSTSPAMYAALAAEGLRYDASGVSDGPAEPRERGRTMRYSLPMIPEGPRARPVIAMDYNLYVRHSGGVEQPEKAEAFRDRAVAAFLRAFDREMSGKRRPFQIGMHFTLMNGGAYWDALERFAVEVCGRAEVRCISYRDHLRELDEATPRG